MVKESCPKCGSSDGLETSYPSGPYCFVCKTKFYKEEDKPISTRQVIPYRSHTVEALRFFGVYQEILEDGTIDKVFYPYPSFIQIRKMPKQFYIEGKNPKTYELFGMDKFSAGSAPAITITEGAEDALSVFDIFDRKYPVVSVMSSSDAHKTCAANYDYLNSFDKIYISFDSDEPGQKAASQAASLFPFNKVFLVKTSKYKDANEYLVRGAADEYKKIWWNAKRFVPENLLSSWSDYEEALQEAEHETLATYPFKRLQDMLRGIRAGECVLFKAPEGIGKTEIMGAIEVHVLKETDFNIGIIHLEEPVRRSLQRIATYDLGIPVHLDKSTPYSEILKSVERVVRRENRVHFYKNFGSDDLNGVINNIRFLVSSCECRIIFLDHISRLVSGVQGNDERRDLDFISTRLSQLAEELQFGLVMISHVNDDGKTRGSRNISKEAHAVVSLHRDIIEPDEVKRNTTTLLVEKNRFGSTTGPAGEVYFNFNTFQLTEEKPLSLPEVL